MYIYLIINNNFFFLLKGRELFEKDHSLVDSDLQFLQEGELTYNFAI